MVKRISVVVSFACFALMPLLLAATPRPTPRLQPLLAQLAENPDDAALRTRIIQLVLGMSHPPKVSEQFNEQIGAAGYAFKHATSQTDFQTSIDAFKKASLLAPWVADVYYNIALADEKVQNFDGAILNLRWYLIAKPNAADTDSVQQKIGALQYEKQQKATVNAQATAAARASAAAKIAAAELSARKAAVLGSIRNATFGVNYQMSFCHPPNDVLTGCTLAEMQGKDWYATARLNFAFSFPDPGTVEIDVLNSAFSQATPQYPNGTPEPLFRGTVTPSGSVQWECSEDAAAMLNHTFKPPFHSTHTWNTAFINADAPWRNVTLSCDRPPIGFSSTARYYYLWLRKG